MLCELVQTLNLNAFWYNLKKMVDVWDAIGGNIVVWTWRPLSQKTARLKE